MLPWPQRLHWLKNPWTWVIVAGALRFAVLLSLPHTAHTLAVPLNASQSEPKVVPAVTAFLQSRVKLVPLTEDEGEYDEMARNLVSGRGFVLDSKWLITTPGQPVAYAGFTYPAFVASVYWIFGAGQELPLFVVQILVASVAAWLVYTSAERVGGALAGAVAGAFYAFHPTLIWSSVAMMSESICVPLVALLLYLLSQPSPHPLRRVLLLAGTMALLCLARSTFSYFVWIVAGLLIFEVRKRPTWWARVGPAFVFVASFTACCSPWTIRNYLHWKRIIPFSTKAGVNAWVHNHPGLRVEFGSGAIIGPMPVDVFDSKIQDLPDEGAREAALMKLFLSFVRTEPMKFLGLVWMRFWMAVLPVAVVSKSAFAIASAWYAKGTVLVALAIALWLKQARVLLRILPVVLFALYWVLMQSLAGSGLRYRIPSDPAWAIMLGVLSSSIIAWTRIRLAAMTVQSVGPADRKV